MQLQSIIVRMDFYLPTIHLFHNFIIMNVIWQASSQDTNTTSSSATARKIISMMAGLLSLLTNLKGELESTFKEEISVYFDINPHDGLLETHDVDASLKEKLKCLVFIPIISRTYCDPKSFAWEHEFNAFIEHGFKGSVWTEGINYQAVMLPAEYFQFRFMILTLKIKLLLKMRLGGVLTRVEFIYKESGVNRPLMAK